MTRTIADCGPGYPTLPSPGPRRRRRGRSWRGGRASTRGWGPCGTSGARGVTTWSGADLSGDTWTTVSTVQYSTVQYTEEESRGHCHAYCSGLPGALGAIHDIFYKIRNSWHFNTGRPQLALTLQCTPSLLKNDGRFHLIITWGDAVTHIKPIYSS